MDYFEVIRNRHSIRSFTAEAVDPQQLSAIMEAANAAPSAGNRQSYEMYLIQGAAHRDALADAIPNQPFLKFAPVMLVFCANPELSIARYGDRARNLYALQDATIACTYAMLAATALKLGSVWIGAFQEDAVRHAVGIPETVQPVAILPIGHPAAIPESRPRRSLQDIVHSPGNG
jgi:nitroreductase